MNSKDVVIIGAGPAGIATAIQLKRYAIDTVLLEKDCKASDKSGSCGCLTA
ncbi:MAG TPA: FAD-dependent oxidoreductase [bacterium]|nr:FAD-dependent oxidoreductase [bacterium]